MTATREAAALVTLNRVLSSALFGGQVVWAAAVVRAYRHLTPSEYLKVHTLLTWYGDGFMPALGVSATMTGYLRYRRTGRLSALLGTAALTGAGVAAAGNLHINGRIRGLRARHQVASPATEPDLRRDRDHWAQLHLIRSAGGLLALLSFLPNDGPEVGFGRPSNGSRFGWLDAAAGLILLQAGRGVIEHLAMTHGRGKHATMRSVLTDQGLDNYGGTP